MENRRLRISEDLLLQLLAIVLALSLWVYVQAQQPQNLNMIPLTIEEVSVEWHTADGYVVTAATESQADVTVRGTVDIINALQKSDVTINLDLSEYEPGQHTLTLIPEIPNGITLYNVSPSTIEVVIDEWISREISPTLQLETSLPEDEVIGSYLVNPATVTVEGVAADLDRIEILALLYDPVNMGSAVTSIKPVALDSDGQPVATVVVNGEVDLEVTLHKRLLLPVIPDFNAELPEGLSFTAEPASLMTVGLEEDFAGIESIGTLEIDLTDVQAGDSVEVDLLFPGGIRAENSDIKTVTVTFR